MSDATTAGSRERRRGRPPLAITKRQATKAAAEQDERSMLREWSRERAGKMSPPEWLGMALERLDTSGVAARVDELAPALCYFAGQWKGPVPQWFSVGSGGVLVIDQMPASMTSHHLAYVREEYRRVLAELDDWYHRLQAVVPSDAPPGAVASSGET